MSKITPSQLAACIDHTLLKPEATASQIDQLCDQAVELGCWAVCANLFWLPRVVERIRSSGAPVKIDTPVAYPTGAIPTALKVSQARWALDHGADEIDMIINIGALCDDQDQLVQDDISVSKQNVLRGIHGDTGTWKLISCLYGQFYLVVVNWDKTSPQFRQWESFTLSDQNRLQVLIPPRFGNGHLVQSQLAIFHYKQSTYYDRSGQFTILWNDPALNIQWPIDNQILSRRDSGEEDI